MRKGGEGEEEKDGNGEDNNNERIEHRRRGGDVACRRRASFLFTPCPRTPTPCPPTLHHAPALPASRHQAKHYIDGPWH